MGAAAPLLPLLLGLQTSAMRAICLFVLCRQGHFNLVRDLPFPHIDSSRLGHASHKATAREVAAKGSVLLKNEGVGCCLHLQSHL